MQGQNRQNEIKSFELEVKSMQAYSQDWRALSEAASREQDPEKLMQLVEELNQALLRREQESRRGIFRLRPAN